ncbi:MAG: hypothetical protein IJX89_04295 [Alphaproteobacteria bacterium]|nr:hypothetical protein [Alphaproteobacteria bacterium]
MRPLIALLGFLWAFPIIADEVPADTTANTETVAATVRERLSCDELTAKIAELSAITEPDTITIDELTSYKSEHRRNCSKSMGARRTNFTRASSAPAIATADTTPVQPETTDTNTEAATEPVVADPTPKPELTAEQITENINAGLCADGSEPNKFGCCGDEKFKDLGNTVFACCPPDGGDCFPPLR